MCDNYSTHKIKQFTHIIIIKKLAFEDQQLANKLVEHTLQVIFQSENICNLDVINAPHKSMLLRNKCFH